MGPQRTAVGWFLTALAVCAGGAGPISGQTIQFPSSAPTAPIVSVPAGSAATAAPINPYLGATGAAAPFDPYSASGSAAYQFWSTTPPSNSTGVFAQPPIGTPAPTGTFPTFGPPPASAIPPPQQYIYPNGAPSQFDITQSIKFVQDVRFRHTYVGGGDDPNDVGINDSEIAVTFTIPNFLTTGQPLFISPAFALHLWDGPVLPDADLPPQAYSAYLDLQWASDPSLQIGAEIGFRIGAYTDFNTLNDESLRIQGLGLGVFRFTPTLTGKVGAMYLDRNKIKILPAGGILWTPTPQVRFDFFFPQPKLAAHLTTLGKHDLWWYLAGEYGGGAWTIERADGTSDNVDINDIRVSAGVEWSGPSGVSGFFEGGFVFKRQVIYVVTPSDSFDPGDTFMVRAGISF